MNPPDLDFQLPDWKVLPPQHVKISFDAYLEWLEEYRGELIRTGKLEEIRNDPLRCPVNARFKL